MNNRLSNHGFAKLVQRSKPFVMAHRGNSELCPENTLAAFQRALDDGTDAIETDLHLSSDGELMCIHDGTLERTTNGVGSVNQHTRAELQSLSASYGKAGFESETIPTLRELLTRLPKTVALGLELKSDAFLKADVCLKLARLLEETETLNRVFTLSFNPDRLMAIRRHLPDTPTGLITLFRPVTPPSFGEFAGPLWPILFANPFYTLMAHRRGQLVCPLDPTPEPRLWYYRLMGCDAVLTNNPAKTLQALGRKKA